MVITRVKIEDFDRFWATFRSRGAEKRAQHGCRGAKVFRNQDAADEVMVLFDWDRDDFQAFLEDPEVPEIMREGGLKGPPEPTFVDPAGELAS